MSFTSPYRFRIMTAIGNDVFELKRFQRPIFPADEAFWFQGREDRTWIERPLLDRQTITSRPVIVTRCAVRQSPKLKFEENLALEESGLVKEYKL